MENPKQNSPPKCPQCDSVVPKDALFGACPKCLLSACIQTHVGGDIRSSPPPSTDELKADFPELELLELLGCGGMGAVYKARQKSLDRMVALKLLNPGLDLDPGFSDRFTQEARTLAKLNHPGIVTVYESGQTTSGRYFILMEYVDGVNLHQLLKVGRMSPREALAIVPPLCDALQYAHDHGLVHRDIKPENILVDRLGRVKVADFGLAKMIAKTEPPTSDRTFESEQSGVSNLTAYGQVMGTPEYMAPEQRSPNGTVDHRADIYALGVVLYQLLTGELPEDNLKDSAQRIESLRVDVRLDEVVLRALKSNPNDRYPAASEMKTQVQSLTFQRKEQVDVNVANLRQSNSVLGSLVALVFMFTFLCGALGFAAQGQNELIDVHFGFAGSGDGLAQTQSTLFLMLILGVGLPAGIIGLCYIVRYMPAYLFNLPHRDFWLSPVRREWTFNWFLRVGIQVSIVLLFVLLLLHLGLQVANESDAHFPFFAYAVVGCFCLWAVFMVWRFQKTLRKSVEPPVTKGVSWGIRFAGYMSPWLVCIVLIQFASDLEINTTGFAASVLWILFVVCLLFGLWRTWRLKWRADEPAKQQSAHFWDKVVARGRPWVIFTTLLCFVFLTLGTAFDIFRMSDEVVEAFPELEMLAYYQDYEEGKRSDQWWKAWTPTDSQIIDGRSRNDLSAISLPADRDDSWRNLCVWMTSPALQSDSLIKLMAFDMDGEPLVADDLHATSMVDGSLHRDDGIGHILGILKVARFSENVPERIRLQLDYADDEWRYWERFPVNSEQAMDLANQLKVDPALQNADGYACLELVDNWQNSQRRQTFKFSAVDLNGKRFEAFGLSGFPRDDQRIQSHVFDLPLSQVDYFEVYKRRIKRLSWTVPLLPPSHPKRFILDDLSQETNREVVDIGKMKFRGLNGESADKADLPELNLLYHQVADTDGITGGDIDERHFLVSKARSFKLVPFEGSSRPLYGTGRIERSLEAGVNIPSEASLIFQPIDKMNEDWPHAFELIADDGVCVWGSLMFTFSQNEVPSIELKFGPLQFDQVEALQAFDQGHDWLVQIDDGDYGKSWRSAGQFFRSQLSAAQWVSALSSVRKPLGENLQRNMLRIEHTEQLSGVPDGHYQIITLHSEFDNLPHAVETVTLSLKEDGQWRVVGYFIKPSDAPDERDAIQ